MTWNAEGPEGPPGPSGVISTYERRRTDTVGRATPTGYLVSCDPGDTLLTGGYQAYPIPGIPFTEEAWSEVPASPVIASNPVYTPTQDFWSWRVTARQPNGSDQEWSLTLYVHCADNG